MSTPTDEQLKLALAAELPDLIETHSTDLPEFHCVWFTWRGDFDMGMEVGVSDREWPWVMSEVEKKLLTHPDITRLGETKCAQHWYASEVAKWTGFYPFSAINASWQVRARSYFATIGKDITKSGLDGEI